MSSRQLRKLQKQKELEKTNDLPTRESDESEQDEGPTPIPVKPRVSLFAALGGEDEHDEQDDDDNDNQGNAQQATSRQEQEETISPSTLKKSKKKKKKKVKAKPQTVAAGTAAGDENEDEDEIDKAIKELKLTTQHDPEQSSSGTAGEPGRRINELLSINTYHLKAINEMRNLFGRDIIESANAEGEQEQNRRRRGPVQQQVDLETFLRSLPGAKKLPEVSLRRNVFIHGREHWPRATAGGLMMKQMKKAADGLSVEYAYVHDKNYDDIQSVFFLYIGVGDPMRMVHLLREVPYHVSTLLQVSSVAKQDQNMALAAELCERALFTFGRVATSAFKQDLEQGKARLDFRRPENRQFWLAGYHYLKSLIRKGTYRTALEWAKVLFSLDHSDPYAMQHFIHFLAIRAHESRWLIEFVEELEKLGDIRDTIYLRQSVVLAKLQLNDLEGAHIALRDGMQRVPWLYCALFQELGLDAPPSIWGINPENAESDARPFWVKLYTYHTKDLWNNTGAISLLQQVAKGLNKVDISLLPLDDSPPDLGATRLAYLEGNTSIIAVAPRQLLDRQPNYEFDPLPPAEEDNIFSGEGCRRPWERQTRGSEAMNTQLEAQLRNIFPRRALHGAPMAAAPGAFGGFGDDEENDELDAIDVNDPELAADLEEYARQAQEPGLVETLIRMLRGRFGAEEGNDTDEMEQLPQTPIEDETHDGPLPGAWPDDNDDE